MGLEGASGRSEDVITTTLRVLTWNVWGRFGPWQRREPALVRTLKNSAPDVVTLQESWCDRSGRDQAASLAEVLGYHSVYGGGNFLEKDWGTGVAVLSRWPITRHEYREFRSCEPGTWGGCATFAAVDGPREQLAIFSVILDWPPHASVVRQDSVRQLVSFVREVAAIPFPSVIGGDFNAPPDSDEIRMLTGRTAPAAPGFVLLDAWEMAGNGVGHTWARGNPWTAPAMLPSNRIDYIFVGRPRRSGAGNVVRCVVEGDEAVEGVIPSDHYAVAADLRY